MHIYRGVKLVFKKNIWTYEKLLFKSLIVVIRFMKSLTYL